MSIDSLARLSGFVYLLLILTGIYGLVYVPAVLFDWSSPTTTTSNILDNEMTFRLAVAAEIACYICFIFLPLLLYKLLRGVNQDAALLMVILALLSIPLAFAQVTKHLDVLLLVKEPAYLKALTTDVVQATMMLKLASFNNGILVSYIFSGLWLLPFGYLVYHSGFLPRILGILLMLACFGYLIEFVGKFIFSLSQIPWYISIPSSLGEFGICLWLLMFGARPTVFRKKVIRTPLAFFSSRSFFSFC